ncbi:hypothetical protein P9239_04660 [Caballeronia sp. LZ062]|jgi:hypothetical protein|uniref:hypothetical protein n=1 Tax=unclassified Caballeronia TaxID=2646786 RepID=UPI002028151E|nr:MULTISPECIES: hypothetical protein [unclassified Caballeronia]MDR5856954.1 hypothetical protein [Caballeronia sp. LZ050]MDR5869649.1 hypothetical protein [Caballeronia sp. LZ062]
MKPDDLSFERVQRLVERAENLRMQSAAVPVKDLRILLDVCEIAFAQRTMSDIKTEPEVN